MTFHLVILTDKELFKLTLLPAYEIIINVDFNIQLYTPSPEKGKTNSIKSILII